MYNNNNNNMKNSQRDSLCVVQNMIFGMKIVERSRSRVRLCPHAYNNNILYYAFPRKPVSKIIYYIVCQFPRRRPAHSCNIGIYIYIIYYRYKGELAESCVTRLFAGCK